MNKDLLTENTGEVDNNSESINLNIIMSGFPDNKYAAPYKKFFMLSEEYQG